VTLGCCEETYAIAVQATLSSPRFRCHASDDPLGVQLAGALKNVVAVAAGMSSRITCADASSSPAA